MQRPLMPGFLQVYGGTISIFIGSFSLSNINNLGFSFAQSGDTFCNGCAVSVTDVKIINSFAISSTTG